MDSLYAHALKLLITRPHSKAELRTKLIKVCQRRKTTKLIRIRTIYQPLNCTELTNTILEKLDTQQLLNDNDFAIYWKEQREKYRPRSMLQLQNELRIKGITNDIISKILDNYDEFPLALRIGNKKRNKSKKEIIQYLSSKGFRYSTIQQVIQKFEEDKEKGIIEILNEVDEEDSNDENDRDEHDDDESELK